MVNVSRQIGGNIIQIADDVERMLREPARALPPALRIERVYDLAASIREAVRSVRDAIVIGRILAVFVLLVFLRDWRATAVAALALLPVVLSLTRGAEPVAGGA